MNAKQVAVVISVAVLFALLIGLAIDAIYPSPKWEDICKEDARPYPSKPYAYEVYPTGTNCTFNATLEQEFSESCKDEKDRYGTVRYKLDEKGCNVPDKCDFCNLDFQDKNDDYTRNVFYIAFTIGIIAIVTGLAVKGSLASGFMFGGIFLTMYGIMRYFPQAGRFVRVIIVLVALVIIVYFGRKAFETQQMANSSKKKKR